MTAPGLESLYRDVTEAVLRAESAERAKDVRRTAEEYFRVSCLEEKIARELPPDEPNGAIARRGVVTAALAAKRYDRALEFTKRYLDEPGATDSQRAKLAALRAEAERALRDEASRTRGGPVLGAGIEAVMKRSK